MSALKSPNNENSEKSILIQISRSIIIGMQAHIAILRRLSCLDHTSWQCPFYPSGIDNSGWLKYFSHGIRLCRNRFFILQDSDYIHGQELVQEEPSEFQVHSQISQNHSTPQRLKDVDKDLDSFFEAMRPLADKTLALLIFVSFFEDTRRPPKT